MPKSYFSIGLEFSHFKDDTAKNVIDIVNKHPEKVQSILRSLQENSNILVTKGCYNMSFVHTVLYNYMLLLNQKSGKNKYKNSMKNHKSKKASLC
jgi:hypothetical protein